jgi:hypothetical protein
VECLPTTARFLSHLGSGLVFLLMWYSAFKMLVELMIPY